MPGPIGVNSFVAVAVAVAVAAPAERTVARALVEDTAPRDGPGHCFA
ncbi:hypothetical protein AB0N31_33165 [Streptomyces sp. NPDC051051]